MSRYRWNLMPAVSEKHALNNGFAPLVAQLAFNRGLTEADQLKLFLVADSRLSNDPFLLPDMQKAISRTYQALLSGETIAVYGDYDVDGTSATALLVQGLLRLGAKVIPYIPHRLTEGYGLTVSALEKLHNQGASLVITVDCGITSLFEVRKARRLGLDVIITDHHTPISEIPSAVAVVNPKLPASAYPFHELAGVGVAYKFLQGLLMSLGREEQLEGLADLVCLGTIADISPLVSENRYLVKKGLGLINSNPRLGIKEIIDQSGLTGNLDAEKISWIIAPCLNAAGRLEHAMTSYTLLTTESSQEAAELAHWLIEKNVERQKLTATALSRAREQVLARGISLLLFSSDEDNHAGISGLVASRLAEEFYRPAIVVKIGENMSSGSCRSIPEFNIVAALDECRHLLARFGGHSQAAGFALPTRNLAQLEQQLSEIAGSQLAGVDLRPQLDIDAQLSLYDLGGSTYQITRSLAPFGRGNPLPTFLSCGVSVIDCSPMGNKHEHLRFKLKQANTMWDGVGFGLGDCAKEVSGALNLVYNLEVDNWGGVQRLRLNILDFAPC